MNSAQVAIESWLCMEGLLAALEGTAVLLRDTVDGLNVHKEIVTNAETTSTLLALQKKETKKETGRKWLKK